MAISPAVLQAGVQLTTSAAAIYTTPTNGQTVVRRAVFTNVDTVPRLLTVHRVPSAGSATAVNRIISQRRLTPGESYVAIELTNMVLTGGDMIQALADANTAISAFMSGFTA